MLKKIPKNLVVSIVIVLILCIGMYYSFVVNGANNLKQAFSTNSILCNVYYITQIFASLAVAIAGLVGVWQYFLTSRAERIKLNTDCIQRAIELAEYYKNNILANYGVIRYVYSRCGLYDIVNTIDRNKIIEFDKTELNDLLDEESQKRISEIRISKEFAKAVFEADQIYNLGFQFEKRAKIVHRTDGIEIEINKGIVLQKFMGNIVTETLNNLEFFAMHFSHGTADESVVYQSLHQTYLKMVYDLYHQFTTFEIF